MFGKYVATAVGYLLAVGPDKLSDGCRSIFSRKYGCVEKKNSRINKKNSRSLKKLKNLKSLVWGARGWLLAANWSRQAPEWL